MDFFYKLVIFILLKFCSDSLLMREKSNPTFLQLFICTDYLPIIHRKEPPSLLTAIKLS